MCAIYNISEPWDTTPTSASDFELYDADDQLIIGNSIDRIKKWDLTTFDDLEGGAPLGNIFALYKDRFWIAGDPDFPHRIWYSHPRNAEGWSLDSNWFDVRPEDGGKINALGVENDELMISKANGRWYGLRIFEEGDPTNSRLRIIEDDKGALNKDARTVLEDVLYYLDRNLIGTIPAAGSGGISYIVQEVLDGIQDFDNVAIGSNDGKVYFYLGNITMDLGDTVSLINAVLVLDTVNAAFYLRDKTDARTITRFVGSDGVEEVYFGDSEGKVYRLNTGTKAGQNPIHMRLRTKPYFLELGRNISVSKVGIFMDDPDGTVVSFRTSLTEGFTKHLGTVIEEPIQWFEPDDPIQGPLLQFEISHSNTAARPAFNGVSVVYSVEGEVDG